MSSFGILACYPAQVRKAIIGLDLPNNPLDELIDRLGGPTAVAEMTGRKGRLVRRRNGEAGVKWEARNASGVAAGSSLDMINVHERQMFLDGEKLVAIISEAASAGISLHADRYAFLSLKQQAYVICSLIVIGASQYRGTTTSAGISLHADRYASKCSLSVIGARHGREGQQLLQSDLFMLPSIHCNPLHCCVREHIICTARL